MAYIFKTKNDILGKPFLCKPHF